MRRAAAEPAGRGPIRSTCTRSSANARAASKRSPVGRGAGRAGPAPAARSRSAPPPPPPMIGKPWTAARTIPAPSTTCTTSTTTRSRTGGPTPRPPPAIASVVRGDRVEHRRELPPRRLAPRRDVLARAPRRPAARSRAGSGGRPTGGGPRRARRRAAPRGRSGTSPPAAGRSSSPASRGPAARGRSTSCSTCAPKNLISEISWRALMTPCVSIIHAACSVIRRAACICAAESAIQFWTVSCSPRTDPWASR